MDQESNGQNRELGQFIWLSDLHYDPYYGSSNALNTKSCEDASRVHGQVQCDSPYALVDLVFKQIAQLLIEDDDGSNAPVEFMVVTGDLARHATEQLDDPVSEMKHILGNVGRHLHSTITETLNHSLPIVADIGNNDVTPDYYIDLVDPSETLEIVTNGYQEFLDFKKEERSTFLRGGYFARNVTDKLTIISLNTNFYSLFHSPVNQNSGNINGTSPPFPDPLGQFAWLEKQLEIAHIAQRKVYILGHIPPAMGTFRHAQLWQEYYLEKYYSVLSKYHPINTNDDGMIQGQFFGHLHSDEFRLVNHGDTPSDRQWPLLITSSVTPIYGANPSIRRVLYNRTNGLLVDYETFYIDLGQQIDDEENRDVNTSAPEWVRDESFREAFEVIDMSYESLKGLLDQFRESTDDPNSAIWQRFFARHHVQYENGADHCPDQECRRGFLCAVTTRTSAEYNYCMKSYDVESSPKPSSSAYLESLILIVAAAVLGVAFAFWLQRYLRRRHYQQQIDEQELPEEPNPSLSLPSEMT
mmetsp:Transcript_4769/g.11893  ORF Transcript_4769/g.11893 Transcript_4769/m.11893 type:complete len:526 (-) Transcript_4769:132-1709(-)